MDFIDVFSGPEGVKSLSFLFFSFFLFSPSFFLLSSCSSYTPDVHGQHPLLATNYIKFYYTYIYIYTYILNGEALQYILLAYTKAPFL